jgi:hypothetical protein
MFKERAFGLTMRSAMRSGPAAPPEPTADSAAARGAPADRLRVHLTSAAFRSLFAISADACRFGAGSTCHFDNPGRHGAAHFGHTPRSLVPARHAVIAQAPTMIGRRKLRKRSANELPAMCRPPRGNFRPNSRRINRPLPAAIDRHILLILPLPRRFPALRER